MSLGVLGSRAGLDRHLSDAGPLGEGLARLGYGEVPDMHAMIVTSPFPRARLRHAIADPAMHMHLGRLCAGVTFLAAWVQRILPELRRVAGADLDPMRPTWMPIRGDLRRVRLFVDALYDFVRERRAHFVR